MKIFRRISRLKNDEFSPIVLLGVLIVLIIRLSNKYDEYTANQYVLEERKLNDDQKCSLYPSTLIGVQSPDVKTNFHWKEVEERVKNVEIGGKYLPKDCKSRQELAIIIPLRNRDYQLKLLLNHLHPFLQRQKRAYQIFVVEQFGNGTFNKGLIMNVAFQHASENGQFPFNCFLFHDVDMLPENDLNIYECENSAARHLAPAVDELRYFLMYNDLVGGALAITKEQFLRANGWSNLYWGWGFEDDDMNNRLRRTDSPISRPPNFIGRYKMIRHPKQIPSLKRYETLSKWLRYPHDGIKQLKQLDYSIVQIHQYPLYTHILVNFTRLATKSIDYLIDDQIK